MREIISINGELFLVPPFLHHASPTTPRPCTAPYPVAVLCALDSLLILSIL